MDCFRSVLSHASFPVEERKRMGITDNLVRLSVGLEDVDDIITDLGIALLSVSVCYHERMTCPTTVTYLVSVGEIINYYVYVFISYSRCSDYAKGWTTKKS